MNDSLNKYLAEVKEVADKIQQDVVRRIWEKDYTVWKQNPAEISNRLGWLTVTDFMQEQAGAVKSFAEEVRTAGFRHVVLLGMGGSSLGPEVLRQTFGISEGYPELIVLDSTVPDSVQAVTQAIEPGKTLFLISSKSGTTIEPLCFLQYFLSVVRSAIGSTKAMQNFVAITDLGTPLASYAEKEGFWRVFLNPPDIGGRYSVLSYFGLVPAALIGVDITRLLNHADRMRKMCIANTVTPENPGAWLGTIMGALATKGLDKLTLMTSKAVGSFGLWVEQLIAESTGKEGRGIIPVVGEPLARVDCYGDDRLFIYLRLSGDNNLPMDEAVRRIRSAGRPVVILEMQDRYDLGAEFFRWEFATAIAGAILGVNPFDQPNVQAAKQATESVLHEFETSGCLPRLEVDQSVTDLLKNARSGMYLAILASIHQTLEADKIFENMRRKVLERYHIATTLGYGPRYLHSTGQLHKGGPAKNLLLQVTASYSADIPIPGKSYTFGTLADAQAIGDLQALQSSGRPVAKIDFGQMASVLELIDSTGGFNCA